MKDLREEVMTLLWEEQHPPAVAVAPPAPAPVTEQPTEGPAPEPCNTVALAAAPESQQARVVLVAGASSWSPSRGDVIRERLGRIPAGARVAIYGDAEAHSKRGLPTGAAAIARVAFLGRDVELVTEDGLDEALGRVEYVLIFHPTLDRSVGTAAVVTKARELRIPVEVVTESADREHVEVSR